MVDLPLWKMMEFVSWDDDLPNWMESHNPFMFQSPPTSDTPFQSNNFYMKHVSNLAPIFARCGSLGEDRSSGGEADGPGISWRPRFGCCSGDCLADLADLATKKTGTTENSEVYFMENPNLKSMIWGYPHFRKPPYGAGSQGLSKSFKW